MRPSLRIAVYLPLATEHGRSVLRGVAQFFRQRPDVTVLKFNDPPTYSLPTLRRLKVDGMIARVGTRRNEAILRSLGLPVVNVSGQVSTRSLPTVNTDDGNVGRMALRYFYGRGHRNFAYCGSATHLGSIRRYRAFCAEAKSLALHRNIAWHNLPWGDQNSPYPDPIRQRLVAWVKTLSRPVAILAFTDRVALEVDEACARLGFKVPADIALLGVGNDLARVEFAHVPLSSIQLNAQHIGFLAAEKLHAIIEGKRPDPAVVLVPPRNVVTRGSTDRFAVNDEAVALALDYMREHVGNSIYVADVARAAGVTRRVLELRFRAALNSSIHVEAQRLHFERSVDLMADPSMMIGEIAYASGFESLPAFTTAFRRRYGVPPTTYRARLLQAS